MREAKALSLRQVEAKSGISNAFISQMESGKVKQPSPVMLYKLAEVYGVPYESLMELAGYPSPSALTTEPRSASAVFRRFGEITPTEEAELLDYLSFLRSRTRKGRRGTQG
jgi:transcriptional regulator with XRE-family HTH domain